MSREKIGAKNTDKGSCYGNANAKEYHYIISEYGGITFTKK